MEAIEFDVIPFEDFKGKWKKLGAGSFGNVYKAKYLGIDVAIKEVLPSDDYNVSKYFEREWRLMKEARHPNVVLYIALSRAPQPDNRIFIVSEFIENGNLRQYIYDKNKPLPWRLRLSFATDVVRAMAYLHARHCIHRDLKPENLLITANGRIKVTDFGFARIMAQTVEETRRLTFCGTDSYMSPEILMGDAFGLETDIFSLGIIFCELASRKLADDDTFKRVAPHYELSHEELYQLADPEAPPAFIQLTLACCARHPMARPTMRQVLERLEEIEKDMVQQSISKGTQAPHIGSVKFLTANGKPVAPLGKSPVAGGRPVHTNRRIPSFGMGVMVGRATGNGNVDGDAASIETGDVAEAQHEGPDICSFSPNLPPPGGTGPIRARRPLSSTEPSEDEEDEELEAILALNGVDVNDSLKPFKEASKHLQEQQNQPPQLEKASPQSPAGTDASMSWRLTGWMKEYAERVLPQVSASTAHQPTVSLDHSTDSLLARVPLLSSNRVANKDGPSSTASSVLTIRQTPQPASPSSDTSSSLADAPVSYAPMDSASGSIRRSQHRRQPNDLVVPSATLSTVQSETEREAEAGTAESYFTAASPSIFPVPPTIVQPSITPNPVSPQASEKQSPENVVPEPPPTHPPTTNVGQPLASPPRNNTQHVHPYSQPNVTFSPRMHRFSLIKSGNAVKRGSGQGGVHAEASTSYLGGWSAFELLFGSAFGIGIGSRCDICAKRLGWKPCLECDDCGVITHMKCGESAPMDCETRQLRRAAMTPVTPTRSKSPKFIASSPKAKSPKAILK